MTLASLYKGIKATFMTMMETPVLQPYNPLVQTVMSQSNSEDYWIPLASGDVRKLLDSVQFKELNDKKMTIVNEDYYDSIREYRNNIEDSKEYLSANVQMQISSIVSGWQSFKVTRVDQLINDNGNAFDGQAYFSTSNRTNISSALGSTGVINKTAGAGTTTTLLHDDFGVAKTAIMSYRDKNKKYFNDPNNMDLYVLTPVALVDTFKRILDPGMNVINVAGNAVSNPYAGAAKIIVYNTTTNNWILANGNAPVKPFILQERQEPEWNMEDDKKTKFVDFWYNARMGAGYGSPFAVHMIANA